jgi:proline iminopeptidase
MARPELFPPTPIRAAYHLPVSPLHRLWVEEAGNPQGIPVLILHGGPGGMIHPGHRRLIDPDRFRIISFDQRGAGRSEPLGGLTDNRLDDLAADVETLRRHLGVDRWVLLGHSFGGAIALRYAQLWPQHCRKLILVAPVTGRDGFETHDFLVGETLAPQAWPRLAKRLPGHSGAAMASACFAAILAGGSPGDRVREAWYGLADALARNGPVPQGLKPPSPNLAQLRAAGALSAHYWRNQLFLPPGGLCLAGSALAEVRGCIFHGAKDGLIPSEDSAALCRVWPGSRLFVAEDAGHDILQTALTVLLRTAFARI